LRCRKISSVSSDFIEVLLGAASGAASHQGFEFRKQGPSAFAGLEQRGVREDRDGLAAIGYDYGRATGPGPADVNSGRGMEFFDGDA
jgi:hypothetical protein